MEASAVERRAIRIAAVVFTALFLLTAIFGEEAIYNSIYYWFFR
jgi:hypothetical protein